MKRCIRLELARVEDTEAMLIVHRAAVRGAAARLCGSSLPGAVPCRSHEGFDLGFQIAGR
jgi:hypothetical protein